MHPSGRGSDSSEGPSWLRFGKSAHTTPGAANESVESAFAHDASGARIRSRSFGTYLMEPSSPAWQQQTVNRCRGLAAGPTYDGCLVDTLTMAVFTEQPVESPEPYKLLVCVLYDVGPDGKTPVHRVLDYGTRFRHDLLAGREFFFENLNGLPRYGGGKSSTSLV